MPKRSRMPRDPSMLAKKIIAIATGEEPETAEDDGKDPAAVALGRKGGLKGGKARAARMTAKQRSEAARKAARARWGKEAPTPTRSPRRRPHQEEEQTGRT